jgi:hypothetical protein
MSIKTTLRFLRSGESYENDDVIKIYSTRVPDTFRVVYTPADSTTDSVYTAFMSRGSVLSYITDILKSMKYDVDPFDRIQISTDLHPSIMYSASDMDDVIPRRNLENMLHTSLRTTVVHTRG